MKSRVGIDKLQTIFLVDLRKENWKVQNIDWKIMSENKNAKRNFHCSAFRHL